MGDQKSVNRTARFWKNIGSRPTERGNVYGHDRGRGFALPSHSEMDAMEKHGVIFDVDPGIRALILDLNRKKFKTEGSCAGHIRGRRGFVTVVADIKKMSASKKEILKAVFKKHGMKNLRVYQLVPTLYLRVTFDAIPDAIARKR